MKYIFIVLFSLLLSTISYGQVVNRYDNETTEQFVKRLQPIHSQLTSKVIETTWNSNPVIIAFYMQTFKLPKENDPDQDDYMRIIARLYVQQKPNEYKNFLIDTINSEGGDPRVESVFFANADKDKATELVLLISWEQHHFDIDGTLYGTFIYDDVLMPHLKLNFKKAISEKLDGGFDGLTEGTKVTAKFKTSNAVKAELKKLGFD